jgi:hypothetical protein
MEQFDDLAKVLTAIRAAQSVRTQFDRDVKAYRTHIGKIDNWIKHQQERLRFFESEQDGRVISGYYVETPYAGGSALGPIAMIHDGGHTAFSYNRDLRYHAASLVALAAFAAGVTVTTGTAL